MRALETDVWARRSGSSGSATAATTFDADRIESVRRSLEEDDRAWLAYFEGAGVEPLRVVYEELAADSRSTTLAVLRYLGLGAGGELVVPEPDLRPQADAVTEEWVTRYLRATGRASP